MAAFESFALSGPHSKDERSGWQISWSKQSFSLKPKKDEPNSQPASVVRIAYTALGLMAIGLGVVAWTRKEQARIAGGAAALGLIAVAWQWVLLGVGIAVLLLILASLSM
ncbi:MAG: hypothetical protein JNN01_09785 [Opitutaceae bacterium]|nr:hypothetical protein [Opitutaceae bacterium]